MSHPDFPPEDTPSILDLSDLNRHTARILVEHAPHLAAVIQQLSDGIYARIEAAAYHAFEDPEWDAASERWAIANDIHALPQVLRNRRAAAVAN